MAAGYRVACGTTGLAGLLDLAEGAGEAFEFVDGALGLIGP
ncbi:MAG: hypothetical protein ACREOV_14000 [Candidatus Dormibacteraceae bacterium]